MFEEKWTEAYEDGKSSVEEKFPVFLFTLIQYSEYLLHFWSTNVRVNSHTKQFSDIIWVSYNSIPF